MRNVSVRGFGTRFCKADDGASALEFAMILPVFAAMLFGTIQISLAYYTAGSVQFALERTARITMVDQDMSGTQVQAAFDAQLATLSNEDVSITYTVDSSGDIPIAIFAASYTHHFVIPFVPVFDITFPVETRVPLEPT